ncbi:MAG: MMPL family transporter [Pseudomonadota bacterium]
MDEPTNPMVAATPPDARSKAPALTSTVLLIVLVIAPLVPLLNLTINNVPKVYLPPNAAAVEIDDLIREFFPNDQGIAFLFEGPDLYSEQLLLSLDDASAALLSQPNIQKVYSPTRQDHIRTTSDGFRIEPLLNVSALSSSQSERRERALADPLARGTLIAEDGSALALVVIPETLDDSFSRIALQTSIYEVLADHGLTEYITAEAGLITTDVEQTREFLVQMSLFIPITVLVGLIMVWLLFRRLLAVTLGLVCIVATVAPTIALYSVLDLPFNLISSILPPLLCALSIAALIHLFTGLRLASRRGLSGAQRVRSALQHIRRPGLYSALTTMAGFGALGLSEIRPISHLGLICAFGVGLNYLVAFYLLPPLIEYLDHDSWDRKRSRTSLSDRLIRRLFHTGTRRPATTLLLAALALSACAPLAGRIIVETNLLEFFAPGHKTRVATERFESKLAGTGSIDILLQSNQPEGLIAPDALTQIDELMAWAESQEEVDRATSFVDHIEQMHTAFNSDRESFPRLPKSADLVSQYLFVYDGTDLFDFVDPDFQVGRIHLNLNVHGARAIASFVERLDSRIETMTVVGIEGKVAGLGRMFSDQVYLLISGQLRSILGAIGIIFVLMWIEWRSLRDSLVCLLPNLAPVLLIFILMGVLNLWLDVATAMIASVAVGIAIDDTVHIFHGFIHRVRAGVSPVLAISRTYHYAGRAVTTTTVILCAQFLILTISDFVPIRHFGLLASTGLLAALFFDLLLLPAILMLVYRGMTSAVRGRDEAERPAATVQPIKDSP